MKEIIIGISILMGTIIGGGIFGLPYAFFKGGFFLSAILLLGLAILVCFLHLFYLEIIHQDKNAHRFVGYIEKHLGKRFKKAVAFSIITSFWSSLLIYLILGGNFLSHLLNLEINLATILFFSLGSVLIYFGLKKVSLAELFGSVFLIFVIGFLFFKAFSKINFSFFSFDFNFAKIFLPYGVILYSLYGRSAIPEMASLVSSFKKQKIIIILGTFLPAILYFLFVFTILGTSEKVFPFPEKNLAQIFGKEIIFLFNFFGFFCVFTSFLIIGSNLKESFSFDFSFSKNFSFFLAVFVPLFFYFLGVKDFVGVISFCGGVLVGLNSIFLLLAYLKLKKKKYPSILAYFLIFIFSLGIFWEFFEILKNLLH